MLTVCYAAKGGQGTTTVTAALAVAWAGPRLVAVDAGGDLATALGVDTPDPRPGQPNEQGLGNLLADPEEPLDADALAAMAHHHHDDGMPALVPEGRWPNRVPADWWRALAASMRHDNRHWLVDAGTTPAAALANDADQALLVTTNCYLALRRAKRRPLPPATGAVLVQDTERALTDTDVTDILGVPLAATIRWDRRVASALDAGVLASRLPRPLRQAIDNIARPTQ